MCGFNYRSSRPCALARQILEAGELGDLFHARFAYLQAWGAGADESVWRFDASEAGSGALGDLASHVVDLARFLVGEIDVVTGLEQRFVAGRAVDDAVAATLRFSGGAVGTLEATRFATGNVNRLMFEINGARGAVRFDLERLNELEVSDGGGYRRIFVDRARAPLRGVLVAARPRARLGPHLRPRVGAPRRRDRRRPRRSGPTAPRSPTAPLPPASATRSSNPPGPAARFTCSAER